MAATSFLSPSSHLRRINLRQPVKPPFRIHISSCLVSDKPAAAAAAAPPASSLKGKEVMETEANVFVQTYARAPLVLERGQGCVLYDVEGREYLDMTAGIAVNSLGHGDPDWLKAVMEQAGTLTHVSDMYYSVPMNFRFKLIPTILNQRFQPAHLPSVPKLDDFDRECKIRGRIQNPSAMSGSYDSGGSDCDGGGYSRDGGGGYSRDGGGGYGGNSQNRGGGDRGSRGGGDGGRGGGREGDWVCPNASCGNVNFARRFECNKCATPCPSGGGGGRGGNGVEIIIVEAVVETG